MARQSTSFHLTLPPRERKTPAYRWLYTALRHQILDGRLRPGTRVPATRDLADQYHLSRGTVISAFEQLKSEGYVEGTIGSGTYVSRVIPDNLLQVRQSDAGCQSHLPARRRLSGYAKRVTLFPNYEPRPTRAFRSNLPALDLFPTALWAQITARRMRTVSTTLLMGCDALGYRPLREAVANYLGTSRGVKCAPEQVVIVAGVQEALDLAARLFLDPGDRVCMEEPGYTGAAIAFESVGAKVSAIPLDAEGMRIPSRRLKGTRLVYVTPGHQFPLGTTMSLARRLALLEWARSLGALIFEDDYDSEYRYSGHPVPALQGLDENETVLFAGSFSKVLFPSLRLGYLVIPGDLVPTFAKAKSVTTRHAQLLDQAVLCDFIAEGHFARHLRRMRAIYAERLSILLECAKKELDGLLEISNIEAGLQTVGWLPKGMDAQSVAQSAALQNVYVTPLSDYYRTAPPREGLQIGFAAIDPREIRRGIQALKPSLSLINPR